jgi:hypothetical protein
MFTTMWQKPNTDTGFLEQIVEKWRLSVSGSAATETSQTALFADAMGLTNVAEPAPAPAARAPADPMRRYPTPSAAPEAAAQRPRVAEPAGYGQMAPAEPQPAAPQASNALRNLRDRLNRNGR